MSNRTRIEQIDIAIKALKKVRDELAAEDAPHTPIDVPPNEALHRAGYGTKHHPITEEEEPKEKE